MKLTERQLIALLSTLVSLFWGYELLKLWLRIRLKLRFRNAMRLEKQARQFLIDRQWTVVGEQIEASGRILVDSQVKNYKVRVDYLVTDSSGKLFVAEVKAGATVTSPSHRETRRQLLEYRYIFQDAQALLLVDMTERSIKRIDFPLFHRDFEEKSPS